MNEQVVAVNHLLEAGEPGNITKADTNGYVGYEPQAIIDAMNEVFDIGGWGFEELSSETVDNEKGTLAVAQIAIWIKGIDFKPFSWGQSRVTRGDTGDAKKGAQTDAIKKALSYFSIGNRAYHGLLDSKQPASGATQRTQQAATAQAISANPQPAQARQEPTQGTEQAAAIRAKIDALLAEFATLFPNAAKKPDWQQALAQRVWGEVPEAYTLDHYRTLNAYYLKQKSAGKTARVHAM